MDLQVHRAKVCRVGVFGALLHCAVCGRACSFWSWVPVVAPHIGAVLGAWLYIAAIGAHLRHREQLVEVDSELRERKALSSSAD